MYKEDRAIAWVTVVAVGFIAVASWYSAQIEAEVWNRCHPTQSISAWEAFWTNTRIDNCDVE